MKLKWSWRRGVAGFWRFLICIVFGAELRWACVEKLALFRFWSWFQKMHVIWPWISWIENSLQGAQFYSTPPSSFWRETGIEKLCFFKLQILEFMLIFFMKFKTRISRSEKCWASIWLIDVKVESITCALCAFKRAYLNFPRMTLPPPTRNTWENMKDWKLVKNCAFFLLSYFWLLLVFKLVTAYLYFQKKKI